MRIFLMIVLAHFKPISCSIIEQLLIRDVGGVSVPDSPVTPTMSVHKRAVPH
jgi:hypothetical protein